MNMEKELLELKERVSKLEGKKQGNACCSNRKEIELEIEWPEAQIEGLKFTYHETKSVFELKEDGNYYSRDILIHSARDTDNSTGRDLLSEYLSSDVVIAAFMDSLEKAGLPTTESLRIFLPEKNQGGKKYNGVSWWYWLKPRLVHSAAGFCRVYNYGYSGSNNASSVGGVATAFCIA